jgi:hypothetical protein
MTSDHRVAGSSPAGCKSSSIADRQTIQKLKKPAKLNVHSRFIRTF